MDIRLNYGGIPAADDNTSSTPVEAATSAASPISPAATSSSYYYDYSRQGNHGSHSQHLNTQHDPLTNNHFAALDWSQVLDYPALQLTNQQYLAGISHPQQQAAPFVSRPFVPSFWETEDSLVPNLEATEQAVVDLTTSQTLRSPPDLPLFANSSSSRGITSDPQLPLMPHTRRDHQQARRPSRTITTLAPLPQPSTDEPNPKRRRISRKASNEGRSNAVKKEQAHTEDVEEIEELDLTEVNSKSDLSKALSKQQQDAVTAQMKENASNGLSGRTPLSSYKCPICMDTPEDATTTICGKLFTPTCSVAAG